MTNNYVNANLEFFKGALFMCISFDLIWHSACKREHYPFWY